MSFVPIQLRDYVRLHLKSNPQTDEKDLTRRLEHGLEAYRRDQRCSCGEPIWVIGSAEVGRMCFACITGSTDASSDYEIAEACDKWGRR